MAAASNKPGYQTTEFWATALGTVLVTLQPMISPVAEQAGEKTSIWATALMVGLYSLARGFAKGKLG